jgi:hypothetical protein
MHKLQFIDLVEINPRNDANEVTLHRSCESSHSRHRNANIYLVQES